MGEVGIVDLVIVVVVVGGVGVVVVGSVWVNGLDGGGAAQDSGGGVADFVVDGEEGAGTAVGWGGFGAGGRIDLEDVLFGLRAGCDGVGWSDGVIEEVFLWSRRNDSH